MNPSETHQPSPEAIEFAGFVLLHCAAIADDNRQGELICPFTVLWNADGRRVAAFEAETQEEAVEKAWSSLVESRELEEWWALGREGLMRTGEETVDLLVVSVWTPDQEEPFTVTQGFRRASDGSIYLIGQTDLLVGGRKGAEYQPTWDTEALVRGIRSHPAGGKWASWHRQ